MLGVAICTKNLCEAEEFVSEFFQNYESECERIIPGMRTVIHM